MNLCLNKITQKVIVLSCLLLVSCAYAEEQNVIQSLQNQLKNTKKNKQKAKLLIKIADLYKKNVDFDNAEKYYHKALKSYPNKKKEYYINITLGDMKFSLKSYAAAIERYQKAIQLIPKKETARLRLAKVYEESDLAELARQEYLKILKKNKRSFDANYELGSLYLKLSLNSMAMEYYRKAITIKPDANVYRKTAECAKRIGDDNLAISMLKQINSSERKYEDYIQLGMLYQDRENFKESDESFSAALKINPDRSEAYIYLGILYLENQKYKPAEKLLLIVNEKEPHNALVCFFLAQIFHKEGNSKKAEDFLNRAKRYSKSKVLGRYIERYSNLSGK